MKVKTVNCSFSLTLTLWRLSLAVHTVPVLIAWFTYRNAGLTVHRGRPGGWSRYPKREWACFGFVFSVSSGEFGRSDWPEELDV
jgi:hypothetical protein